MQDFDKFQLLASEQSSLTDLFLLLDEPKEDYIRNLKRFSKLVEIIIFSRSWNLNYFQSSFLAHFLHESC